MPQVRFSGGTGARSGLYKDGSVCVSDMYSPRLALGEGREGSGSERRLPAFRSCLRPFDLSGPGDPLDEYCFDQEFVEFAHSCNPDKDKESAMFEASIVE